jgi:hypothetical protein
VDLQIERSGDAPREAELGVGLGQQHGAPPTVEYPITALTDLPGETGQ